MWHESYGFWLFLRLILSICIRHLLPDARGCCASRAMSAEVVQWVRPASRMLLQASVAWCRGGCGVSRIASVVTNTWNNSELCTIVTMVSWLHLKNHKKGVIYKLAYKKKLRGTFAHSRLEKSAHSRKMWLRMVNIWLVCEVGLELRVWDSIYSV